MSISVMRDAIVAQVKKAFPALHVEAVEGQLSAEDFKRLSAQPPSAFVSCVGIADSEDQGGEFVVTARWAVSVVTDRVGDRAKTASRADAATAVLEAFLALLADQQWKSITIVDDEPVEGATTAAGMADRIRANNVYSPALDQRGLTLWSLTWEQDVAVIAPDASTLPDFLVAKTTFDINRDGTPESSLDVPVRP